MIVDDHKLVRAGLRMLLQHEPEIVVAGEAESGELKPDIALVDLAMPGMTGWQVIQEPDRLRVLVAGLGEVVGADGLADAIRATLAAQDVVVPPIAVEHVEAIPRGPTGKAPLVISTIGRTALP